MNPEGDAPEDTSGEGRKAGLTLERIKELQAKALERAKANSGGSNFASLDDTLMSVSASTTTNTTNTTSTTNTTNTTNINDNFLNR